MDHAKTAVLYGSQDHWEKGQQQGLVRKVHDLPNHSAQLCNKVIKPPNSVKIATHLNLKIGLMFPCKFLVDLYLFGKR